MTVATRVDQTLRDLAARRLSEFRLELGRALVGQAVDTLIKRVAPASLLRKPEAIEREALVEALSKTYGERLGVHVLPDDVGALIRDAARSLIAIHVLRDRPDLLAPAPPLLERATEAAGDVLGFVKPTLFSRVADHLAVEHEQRLKTRMKTLDWRSSTGPSGWQPGPLSTP